LVRVEGQPRPERFVRRAVGGVAEVVRTLIHGYDAAEGARGIEAAEEGPIVAAGTDDTKRESDVIVTRWLITIDSHIPLKAPLG
jgi:hypothetical protein